VRGAPHAALACGGFEPSSERGFSHNAVRANVTGSQIRPKISRISRSRKQAGGRALIPKNAFGCRIPAVFRVRFFSRAC
jgi:hypothetical protein